MPLLSHKWMGPSFLGIAVAMLSSQVYLYTTTGLVSAWLLGGGIGLLFLGGVASFHYLGDRRSGKSLDRDKFPTAEEFDECFGTKSDEGHPD